MGEVAIKVLLEVSFIETEGIGGTPTYSHGRLTHLGICSHALTTNHLLLVEAHPHHSPYLHHHYKLKSWDLCAMIVHNDSPAFNLEDLHVKTSNPI